MASKLAQLKVALVADWLTDRGGAERVFLDIADMFPEADIFTSVFKSEAFPELADRKVFVSFLQKYPLGLKHQLWPHMRPMAFEQFDFSDYDLVISSSSAESKGIITKPETCHICYCHTPTRYYWSHYQEYLKRNHFGILDPIFKMVMPGMVSKLRLWDRRAADRVDFFIANSHYVKNRIAKYYLRDAEVVYPPANTGRFTPAKETGDYFLVVGRQIPYKRTDLVVEAFNKLELPLWVIGDGPELKRLTGMAKPNIHFLGRMSDVEVAQAMSRARALIFPQEEDFGIVPLEAQAAGRPVIAYGAGGAKETVVDGKTGLFFYEQTPEALIDAVQGFQEMDFSVDDIVGQAARFDTKVFKLRLGQAITKAYTDYRLKMGLAPRI